MRISLERKKVTIFRSGEFRVYPRSLSGCMLLIKDLWSFEMRELICTVQNFSTGKDARGEIQIVMQDVRLDQQTDMAELIADGDLWAVAEKLIEHGFIVTPPVGTSFDFESGALSKPLPF